MQNQTRIGFLLFLCVILGVLCVEIHLNAESAEIYAEFT